MKTWKLAGFAKYIIKGKKLYRKPYKTKHKIHGWQYRNERQIKK